MELAEQIGRRLRRLREERAWTQHTLAPKVGVSQSTIAGVESGSQMPGTALLGRLADTFQVGLDFFYRAKENPFEVLLRAEEVTPEHRQALRSFAERCARYREIEQALGLDVPTTPGYSPPGKGAHVVSFSERLAEEERRRLNIGAEPPCDLARVLECEGVRVMGIDVPAKLDGLFLFAEAEGAFVLVNTASDNKERQLFTLAHEYGHILMHRNQGYRLDRDVFARPSRGDLVEMAANAFAAAFLMPTATIQTWWDKTRRDYISKIIWLRRLFGVSYRALGWRLMNLGLISESERARMEEEENDLKRTEEMLYRRATQACVDIPSFSDRQRFLALKAFLSSDVSVTKLAQWMEIDVVEADRIAKTLARKEEPRVPTAD